MTEKKTPRKNVEDNQIIAAIGYLGILCFVPLLLKKESKFAQFHGKQGLALFIVEIGIAIISIIPFIGWLIGFIGFFICAAGAIYGIIMAMEGKMTPIPGLSMIAEKLNI